MKLHTASLVWATPNAENLIVDMARVSNPKNQGNTETAPRLLRYLVEHKHWSPFEMANMTVEIVTTRAIAPQILRHRSFSFQEFSQRYASVHEMIHGEPEAVPLPELRTRAEHNRQGSADPIDEAVGNALRGDMIRLFDEADALYTKMLNAGVAPECARMVLPAHTPTRMYMNGTLRSWIHYIDLRTQPNVQREHRRLACHIAQIFREQFPVIASAALGS